MVASTKHTWPPKVDLTLLGNPVRLPGAGTVLCADVYGRPSRQMVLLLHGGGQTRRSWAEAAVRIAASGRQVIVPDLRGHGDSSWAADGDYRLEAFAGDVRAIIHAIGGLPVIVGASLGGLASLLAVGEAPWIDYEALVLVDIAIDIEIEGVDRIVSFMTAAPDGFATLEDAADAVGAYRGGRSPRNLGGLAKNLRKGHDGRWRWHWDPAFILGDRTPRSMLAAGRLESAARAVCRPTLLVRGSQSDLLSRRGAARLLELVPGATTVDVHGAGHMVVGDHNGVFVDAVLRFLDDIGDDGRFPRVGGSVARATDEGG